MYNRRLKKLEFRKSFSSVSLLHNFKHTKLSLCSGSTGVRLLEETIGQTLDLTARKFPYVNALISAHQNKKLMYEELNLKVDKVAKSLIALNLPFGAKVGVYAPNCEEWVLTQFACARVGFVLVNINPAYQVNDLKYALKKIGVNTLIMPRCMKKSDYLDILNQIVTDLKDPKQNPLSLKLEELPNLKQIILLEDSVCGEFHVDTIEKGCYKKLSKENNLITWEDFFNQTFKSIGEHKLEEEFMRRKDGVKIDDITNIQFTSGTTGLPKGAMLSHYNILNNGYLIGRNMNYSDADRVLIQVPLYHCFGSVMANLACITHGATMIYPNGFFDAVKSLHVIEKEKPNTVYGVPTMFLELLNHQQKLNKDISSIRKGIMAGSVCPKYLMDRCIKELGMTDLTIGYGMTELSPLTHQTHLYDSFEKKTTTVGSLLPHTITKVIDESGAIVDRNVVGEICSKSYGLMLGYYLDEKATADAIDSEAFMHTGDLGYIDNDGYLHIEGRKKDSIIRGGENISPKEVEDFLGTHPLIDDVQVLAAKDEKFGDEICAWVKLKDGHKGKLKKEDVINYCKKQIAHYKIPRYVRFVESFPMTVTGKPQKYKMREITNQIIKDKTEEI